MRARFFYAALLCGGVATGASFAAERNAAPVQGTGVDAVRSPKGEAGDHQAGGASGKQHADPTRPNRRKTGC
jgi:hypothetical protein